jgi:hypothetical protein
MNAAEQEALGIYVVMARDASDALGMINECTDREVLAWLLKLLKSSGSPNTDRGLNELMVGPVERRLEELDL